MSNQTNSDIAIIGMSCRLPGNCSSPDLYYDFLLNGGDGIVDIPRERWDSKAFYDEDKNKTGKMFVSRGGFISGLDQFDPQFFGISPNEAPHIDPQHRWLLEITHELLENAGQKASDLKGSDTAVFIGQFMHDYEQIQLDSMAHGNICNHSATGSSMTLTANRLSYIYDFTGPSVALDTACSSSLVAIDMACKSIINGDSKLAIAGGVNLLLRPELTLSICKASMLSPDAKCKSFDAKANGYVRSEGAGLVMLKSLKSALIDGDNILAVIKSSGINQDGHTNGITVPNGEAQKKLINKTLQKANITPNEIQYIEAHGTGTPVGDPIEVNALGSIFGIREENANKCLIGSVKSNIGHTEAAAGVAGLIKVVMSMNSGVIPSNLHYNDTNPAIDLKKLNVDIVSSNTQWPISKGEKRRALVNSFGFGGTNANVIVEQAPMVSNKKTESVSNRNSILVLSSKTKVGLKSTVENWLQFLPNIDESDLSSVCYSACIKRDHFKHRISIKAPNKAKLILELENFLSNSPSENYSVGAANLSNANDLCFTFSGMGTTWARMGKELYIKEPVFKAAIDRCSAAIEKYSDISLVDEIYHMDNKDRIHTTNIAQPAIFATQVALTELYESWGIKPSCIVGHSAGEVAAAYASGALSFDDAIKVIYHRSRLQHTTEGSGKMLAVALSEEELTPYLMDIKDRVTIAAINSERAITLAGCEIELEKLSSQLDIDGVFSRMLNVNVPYHSPIMDRIKEPLVDALSSITTHVPSIPIYSTVTGDVSGPDCWNSVYWAENVRQPVLFKKAIDNITSGGTTTFLEISPHAVLSSSIIANSNEAGEASTVVSSLIRKENDHEMVMKSILELHVSGYTVDWSKLCNRGSKSVSLPNYAWDHNSYWIENEDVASSRISNVRKQGGFHKSNHDLLGAKLNSTNLIWHSEIDLEKQEYLSGHKVDTEIIYPGACYIEMGMELAKHKTSKNIIVLEDIEFNRALYLDNKKSILLETSLDEYSGSYVIQAQDSATENWEVFGKGVVTLDTHESDSETFDIDSIKSEMESYYTKVDFYNHCHQMGMNYEDSFQSVHQCWYGDKISLVEIDLSSTETKDANEYSLHPCILDCAFQSLFPTIKTSFLPVAIEAIRLYEKPSPRCYAHLVTTNRTKTDILGNITILDCNGKVQVEVIGVSLKANSMSSDKTAEKICYDYQWEELSLTSEAIDGKNELWLVLAGEGDNSGDFESYISEHDIKYRSITKKQILEITDSNYSWSNALELLTDGIHDRITKVIYLWPLDHLQAIEKFNSTLELADSTLKIAQAIVGIDSLKGLPTYFFTSASQAILPGDAQFNPEQATIWGFSRVYSSEYPELNVHLVDLPYDSTQLDNNFSKLVRCMLADNTEQELAIRSDTIYVNRLRKLSMKDMINYSERKVELNVLDDYVVKFGNKTIDVFKQSLPPLSNYNVRVRVESSDLDLGAIDTNSSQLIGIIGTIEEIGGGVNDIAAGDKIYCLFNGDIASLIDVDGNHVTKLSTKSALGKAHYISDFVQAHFVLLNCSKLTSGETILLLPTLNSFEHAVIQVAKRNGAKVVAIVHSEKDGEQLLNWGADIAINSSDNDFSQQLKDIGSVDVIFNQSNGRMVSKAIDVIAENGRFLDLTTTEAALNRKQIDVISQKGIIYYPLKLSSILSIKNFRLNELLRMCIDTYLDDGVLPLARQTKSINDMLTQSASLYDNESGSRLICSMSTRPPVVTLGSNNEVIYSNATYLVTGGLGGLGLEVMNWLADNGAKSIVLISRSDARPHAIDAIENVKATGVNVSVMRADVCDLNDVVRVVEEIKRDLPPLRGVIHAAGVLDDASINNQNRDKFANVLLPKIQGTYNLHNATIESKLDLFICFSSIATIIGWPGQSNYAAGNAFMDSFAHWRNAQGFPTLSVNWGPWGSAGMAKNLDDVDKRRMESSGMRFLSTEQAFDEMTNLLNYRVPNAGVFDLVWEDAVSRFANPLKHSVFSNFVEEKKGNVASDFMGDFSRSSSTEQFNMVTSLVSQTFVDILGLGSIDDIEPDVSVFDYGLNSLMSIEFSSLLQLQLTLKVSGSLVSKYQTINRIVTYIVEELTSFNSELTKDKDLSLYKNAPWLPSRYSVVNNQLQTCDANELNHWTQSLVLRLNPKFNIDTFKSAVFLVMEDNDSLRLISNINDKSRMVEFVNDGIGSVISEIKTTNLFDEKVYQSAISEINLHTLPFKFNIVSSDDFDEKVLLLTHHQLLLDGMSVKLLMQQVNRVYNSMISGNEVSLVTGSFAEYCHKLNDYAQSEECTGQLPKLLSSNWSSADEIKTDNQDLDNNRYKNGRTQLILIDDKEVSKLQGDKSRKVIELIARSIGDWAGISKLQFDLQFHGRRANDILPDASSTLGYFTEDYPVLVDLSRKDTFTQINNGMNNNEDYSLLKYLCNAPLVEEQISVIQPSQVAINIRPEFNVNSASSTDELFIFPSGNTRWEFGDWYYENVADKYWASGELNRGVLFYFEVTIKKDGCYIEMNYNKDLYKKSTIDNLICNIKESFINASE
ncbi:type I polyketide synthase [Aliivibrio sifiae]|uniref:Uncharacterized protein n=1 Tax=Aliivibrio sifiae TaxID=566293 RepID=A0A2S7X4F5_9GAMM|nr:type I polyketide synthase [Aliivibrio sifiae]PQJ85134.1 hypothetical protein BTO22_16860 [Aliivibrio sifiae]